MQIRSTNDSTSFGRIGFTNKVVKEAFYKKLSDQRTFNGVKKDVSLLQQHFCRFALEKEANRHDRVLRIGMTNIKGKDVFTCQGEPLMAQKNGKQSFFKFVIGLFLMNNNQYRNAMADVMVKKWMI